MRAYENNKRSNPAVSFSRQNIYEAKSQQQDFLLVGIDTYFVVSN